MTHMRPGIIKSIVIADLIRNPCSSNSWIPGAATPDLIRGRYDKAFISS